MVLPLSQQSASPGKSMIKQLQLDNIRNTLIRLEETIIFGLIERSQFRYNPVIYTPGALGPQLGSESLMEFILHDAERSHAKVRRYTSPDEEPFFSDLPQPILPALDYADCPLILNHISYTQRIMKSYIAEIVPLMCQAGDDGQYGSSSINDVNLLQAIAKRVHYGKFVAECKYRERPEAFCAAAANDDRETLMELITNPTVEVKVLNRVENKTRLFSAELDTLSGVYCITPEISRSIYRQWIIPLNKQVQIDYLMLRATPQAATS
jgi:chorismate mutase